MIPSIFTTTQVKNAIIFGQLFTLFSAFTSIYFQIHGLFGERGLAPVAPMLECGEETIFECRLPLLQFLSKVLHLSPSVSLQLVACCGAVLSFIAIFIGKLRNIVTFAILYGFYATIQEAGGVFMYFQWDSLLLESTAYVAVLAWFGDGPADSIALYGILCLSLRLMFSSGVVKLQSMCPTWWGLTALHHHFESQPLPTIMAWYAHQLPHWFKQFSVLATHFIEIVLPPLFLIPIRDLRVFLFLAQVSLMLLISITGNYTFFNLNTVVILFSLLDCQRNMRYVSLAIMAMIGFVFVNPNVILVNKTEDSWNFKLRHNKDQFDQFVHTYLEYTLKGMIAMFVVTVISTIYKIISQQKKIRNIIHLVFVTALTLPLFIYGTIPLIQLDSKLSAQVNQVPSVVSYYRTAREWSLANSYGLFRTMTGVQGRPEIVIEGATTLEGPWKEIHFYAKPGDVKAAPKFVVPHQPRLDWQMWFAALGTYQQNPFFLSLAHHLMENTTEVVNLIEDYPFKNRSEPMNFVKATLYMYHFTKEGDKSWWTRNYQEDYMPVFNKKNDALVKYLTESKILITNPKKYSNGDFGKKLKKWFNYSTQGQDQTTFVWKFLVVMIIGIARFLVFN